MKIIKISAVTIPYHTICFIYRPKLKRRYDCWVVFGVFLERVFSLFLGEKVDQNIVDMSLKDLEEAGKCRILRNYRMDDKKLQAFNIFVTNGSRSHDLPDTVLLRKQIDDFR